MSTVTIHPGDQRQAREAAEVVAQTLRDGGIVVLPTETVYGLAVASASVVAVERLRTLKGVGEEQAFTIHVGSAAAAKPYLKPVDALLRQMLLKVLPGPVTLKLAMDEDELAAVLRSVGLPPEARGQVWSGGYLRLRCPAHELCQQILDTADQPVLATSAAVPGTPLPVEAAEAANGWGDRVDCVVDGGRCRFARLSTVLRVERSGGLDGVHVERVGVYDARYLQKLMRWSVLFVCSGNTCRSPMAAGIARHLLAQRLDVPVDQLEQQGVRVVSAGAYASGGMPASPEAVAALRQGGIDIGDHRSRTLTTQLIDQADVIYTMTEAHRQAVLELSPSASGKTFRLHDDRDVADPIGAGPQVYQETAGQIRQGLERRLQELDS